MAEAKREEKREGVNDIKLIDGDAADSDMWLFENYKKEHLKSIGVVE
jgi:hypothetical protein